MRKCPVCEGDNIKELHEKGGVSLECMNCGFVWYETENLDGA